MGTWGVFSEHFLNDKHIFPTQQRDVYKIVQSCIEDVNVKRCIIFGSSVTSACNPWSDIDVYYELDSDGLCPRCVTEAALDRWTNFSVDECLLEEILKGGVVVYERNING